LDGIIGAAADDDSGLDGVIRRLGTALTLGNAGIEPLRLPAAAAATTAAPPRSLLQPSHSSGLSAGSSHSGARSVASSPAAPPLSPTTSAQSIESDDSDAISASSTTSLPSAGGSPHHPPFVARPGALLAAAAEAGLGAEASEWLARVRARCPWTPDEVMAALEGGPTLALPQLAATIGRSRVRDGAAASALLAGDDADGAPWLDAVGRQLADPVGRVELVHAARRAAELELFPGGDPRPFVEFVRRAGGGGGLAFELWRLDAGLADAGARRAAMRRADDLARTLATEPRAAAEALALSAGLVADRELGAEARALVVTLIGAAVEGRGVRSNSGQPGADAALLEGAGPALAELSLGEAVDALTRAAEALGAARLDLEAEHLFGALRGLAGRGWQSLASELYGVDWPPLPPALGRDLDALERRYGR